jgi:hypothetical protein
MRRRYLQKMLRALDQSRIERDRGEEMSEVANGYYERRLMQRALQKLRSGILDMKQKARYSRLMNVMVAWRCFVKEKKLLDKYLTECNF